MPSPNQSYNLALCPISINGIRIEGFSEDDVITFEESADDIEETVGADGQTTTSVNNNENMTAVITCMQNSDGTKELHRQIREQKAERQVGAIPRRPFFFQDTIDGSFVSSDFAVFRNNPGPNRARVVGAIEFRVLLVNAKSDMELAPDVT